MCFRLGLHWNHADQYPFLGGSLGSSCMRGLPWSLSQNIDPSSLLSSIPVCISYVALCLCNSFVSYLLKCDIVLVDINEYSSSLCVNWATCTYFVNSYTCAFVSGYTGTHCESGGSLGLSTHYTHVIQALTLGLWMQWPGGPVDLKTYWPPQKLTGPPKN